MEGDGSTVFAHACKIGLEGIVSKRKDSAYRSGRSPDWLKMKNPVAPAVTREAEEDWKRRRGGWSKMSDEPLAREQSSRAQRLSGREQPGRRSLVHAGFELL
jgi:hypothetical protein